VQESVQVYLHTENTSVPQSGRFNSLIQLKLHCQSD